MKHYFTRLEEAMRANWESPALGNYRGELFTFGELATQIAKFHVFFEAIGLKKGDKVALCAKNSARWGVTFFAANTYEAVLVPILADFHPESVNSLVDHSESKVLLTDTDIWNKLDIEKSCADLLEDKLVYSRDRSDHLHHRLIDYRSYLALEDLLHYKRNCNYEIWFNLCHCSKKESWSWSLTKIVD